MLSVNFKIVTSSLMLAILSACGGGTVDVAGSVASITAATTVAGPLAKYAGVWKSDCLGSNSATDTLVISSDGNSMTTTYTSNDYADTACAGAIIATELVSPPPTSTFIKTLANASVTMLSGATIIASVDVINNVYASQTYAVTGSGVTQIVSNGINMWNIKYPDGTSSSIPVTLAARTSQLGLFFLNGKLIIVNPVAGSATSFTEDAESTKVTN